MHILILLLAIFAATPAFAQSQDETVAAVQGYLNGIETMQAHFVQTAGDGRETAGTLLLKRPGRMRIDYDPPVKDFIVADGLLVYYYDGKMKQTSNTPISRSLADFFLRKDLTLSGDVSVASVMKVDKNVELTLTQTKNPLAGSLTLILSDNPMQLQGWRVVDPDGQVISIRLTGTLAGIALDNKLFHYVDPAQGAKN